MSERDHSEAHAVERARLQEEISYMEARLMEIGFEGDCAYERAMSRFYAEQIASRRQQLAMEKH